MVLLFVVARLVDLISIGEAGRRIGHRGGRGNHRGGTVKRRIHRRSINKWLENGTSRPLRNGVIQLAPAVVSSPDQSQDRTGVRVERNQRHLRLRARRHLRFQFLAHLYTLGAHLGDLLIYQLDAHFDGLRCRLLQVGIERGVNPVGLLIQIMFVEPVDQSVAHHIDEIRRVAGLHVRRRQLQRRSLGLLRLLASDGVVFHHRIQHQVAPLQGALGMPVGR